MAESTRITENGQTTIPVELREKYDLELGDEVAWIDADDGTLVRTPTNDAARGLLVPDDASADTRGAVAEELADPLRYRRDRYDEEA